MGAIFFMNLYTIDLLLEHFGIIENSGLTPCLSRKKLANYLSF